MRCVMMRSAPEERQSDGSNQRIQGNLYIMYYTDTNADTNLDTNTFIRVQAQIQVQIQMKIVPICRLKLENIGESIAT